MKDKTTPLFGLSQIVKLDAKVADSGRGRIVGREFGPDNKFLKGKEYRGWVYYVREIKRDGTETVPPAGDGIGFCVSEHELEEWQ